MADLNPPEGVLTNLEVLTNMDILEGEADWALIKEIDTLPSEIAIEKTTKAEQQEKENGH